MELLSVVCKHSNHALLQDGGCYQSKVKQVDQMAHVVWYEALCSEQGALLSGKLDAGYWNLLVCNDPKKEEEKI